MSGSSAKVTITFPDLSPAVASIVAQELEMALVRDGVPQDFISRTRSNPDAMDLGSVVQVALDAGLFDVALEFAKGAASKAGGLAFQAILRKWSARAEVKTPTGECVVLGEEFKPAAQLLTLKQAQTLADLQTLGVVILGASQFPHYAADLKLDNPAFKRSAELAKQIFSPAHTVFREAHVLDLFDQEIAPDVIVDRIEAHVRQHPDIRDLVIYYCGHGAFLPDQERTFYLTLKSTRQGREVTTGLGLKSFRLMIEQQAHVLQKRCNFILDCCFAGAAVEAFQAADIEPLINAQVRELLPSRGMAFLTAAGRNLPAIGRDGKGATMFTGALADVLRGKATSDHQRLSLSDLCSEMTRYIRSTHGLNGVVPQCHSPGQDDGDISRVPMFVTGSSGGLAQHQGVKHVLPGLSPDESVTVIVGSASNNSARRFVPGGGETFQDHVFGPELVVVPAGDFQMGTDPARLAQLAYEIDDVLDKWECPIRRVTVPKPFAVAITPVTVAQFRNFVEDTGRRTEPGAYGYTSDEKLWSYVGQAWNNTNFDQAGDHPVTCVSWLDCNDYISWLCDKTGNSYRFLSEAEWEYCCRAGSKNWFSWGDRITDAMANFDAEVSFSGAVGEFRGGTMPVMKFTPNAWGLYQMHGNVCEWCADPWHETYDGAPVDSRVWIGGNTEVRVWRGGSWWDEPTILRAAARDGDKRDGRFNYTGFRLARDL